MAIIQGESNHLHPCEDKYSPNHDVLSNPSQVFLSLKTKQNKSQCWDKREKRKLNLNKHHVATQRDLQIELIFSRNIYSGNWVAHKATEGFLDLGQKLRYFCQIVGNPNILNMEWTNQQKNHESKQKERNIKKSHTLQEKSQHSNKN